MAAKAKQTPMMEQYWEFRKGLPDDTLLLFRLGDFYEMFFDDAKEGARLLGITLTQRSGYPMAGIPYHAAETYLSKLLAVGKKVAIAEQVETPKPGKLVKRSLSRILTPGTTLEDNQIDANRNHYLLAVDYEKGHLIASWLDLTTGEFQVATDANPLNLLPVFNSLDPREIILPEQHSYGWAHEDTLHEWNEHFQHLCDQTTVSRIADYHFDAKAGMRTLLDALGVINLEGYGIQRDHPALGAAGALVFYATESLCGVPKNLNRITEYTADHSLLIDPATLRNLEIFKSTSNTRKGSLLDALDNTVTSTGSRLLEKFLSEPLLDTKEITRRQLCVGEFLEEPGLASRIHEYLRSVRDITRILTRLQNRIRNPRELGGIRETLKQLPSILDELHQIDGMHVRNLATQINTFDSLSALLERALAPELPGKLQDGGIIADGYDDELDHLRTLTRDVKTWLSNLEREEQEKTGIRNLKIKYNGAFGYFIEITKSNLHLVPDNYIRKQTMTNAERFYTEDLKQKEKEILHAEEKSIAREEILFESLIESILEQAEPLRQTAHALAEIDLYIGWSQLAREWDYCCPTVDKSDTIDIAQGRHPVVEQMLREEPGYFSANHAFVPNDTMLSSGDEQIALITGPNMAGKSTYIRQVALITLMAQVGCWVPASQCRLGLVDRIFSRVGASDELARGNSTFMVEMNETANILNNATSRSLIILDEIGRGTSTYDGLSIAWAVMEHLHGEQDKGPRTLFATHYHELTQLEKSLPRLRNYCVSVKEWNDEIIFVRQVIRGAADRSYGIQVARLAGLPAKVIKRAKIILDELESEGQVVQQHLKQTPKPKKKAAKKKSGKKQAVTIAEEEAPKERPQMELF